MIRQGYDNFKEAIEGVSIPYRYDTTETLENPDIIEIVSIPYRYDTTVKGVMKYRVHQQVSIPYRYDTTRGCSSLCVLQPRVNSL